MRGKITSSVIVRRNVEDVYRPLRPKNPKRIDKKPIDWHYIHVATQKNSAEQKKDRKESAASSSDVMNLAVRQPPKLEGLMTLLDTLSGLERVAEVVREDSSQDMGGAGATAGATAQASSGTSIRTQAIKSLPSTAVMRKRLTNHLQREMKRLERRARGMARSTKKGSAYLLNELYAKIRRIQSLIAELIDAAAEVVRQLYVRLFIDHQQLV